MPIVVQKSARFVPVSTPISFARVERCSEDEVTIVDGRYGAGAIGEPANIFCPVAVRITAWAFACLLPSRA